MSLGKSQYLDAEVESTLKTCLVLLKWRSVFFFYDSLAFFTRISSCESVSMSNLVLLLEHRDSSVPVVPNTSGFPPSIVARGIRLVLKGKNQDKDVNTRLNCRITSRAKSLEMYQLVSKVLVPAHVQD